VMIAVRWYQHSILPCDHRWQLAPTECLTLWWQLTAGTSSVFHLVITADSWYQLCLSPCDDSW
jgi:hypothetical protein